MYSSLPSSFFLDSAEKVARKLIGKGLVVEKNRSLVAVEITEVEAYLAKNDPASHSHRGLTKRNWPMFEKGGICYVYLSYGIHFCMNVSIGPPGEGAAILFRAAKPLEGTATLFKNRNFNPSLEKVKQLLNGPGKLTQALGIDLSDNGREFGEKGLRLVDLGWDYSSKDIGTSPRVGISKATDLPLRFFQGPVKE